MLLLPLVIGSKPTLIPHQTDIPGQPDHKPPGEINILVSLALSSSRGISPVQKNNEYRDVMSGVRVFKVSLFVKRF